MSDELFALIDARGHAAGAGLQRAATTHSWAAVPPKRPVVWVRPALVLAAVVALLAGLVWVAHKPTPPAGHTPAGLRYVIGDVPAGWTLESTQDQSSTAPQAYGIVAASYGTYDDPTAPYVVIQWVDPAHRSDTSLAGTAALNFSSNLREVAAGRLVAVCGDDGSHVFCALDTPNGPMQVQSSHATDEQIEFPIVYCASRAGRASLNKPANGEMPDHENLDPLFDTLLATIPAPRYTEGAPLQAQVTNIDASPFLGRIGMCRVIEGVITKGQQVAWMKADGTVDLYLDAEMHGVGLLEFDRMSSITERGYAGSREQVAAWAATRSELQPR